MTPTRYLLDTSLIVDHVSGYRPAMTLLHRLFDEGADLMTCDVVVCDALSYGDQTQREVVARLLGALDYVAIDRRVAGAAGIARAERSVALADAVIAAAARSVDATVVTRGREAFERLGVSVLTY